MENIEGKYSFKIWKEDDVYLAECWIETEKYYTQGRNEEEIFMMIADLYLTLNDIPCSKWSRFWHKVLRLN